MALCVCKCLNVNLSSDQYLDNVDISSLELSAVEQRDAFFHEKLVSCPSNALKTDVAQPALLGRRVVGRFVVLSCLACGLTTHASVQDRPLSVLINKDTVTNLERINSLRKSDNFSPVFNLLVPELSIDAEMKENVDSNRMVSNEKKLLLSPVQQAIGALGKQLSRSLRTQLEAVEEAVRQFREMKYVEYETYRDKAEKDHKVLSRLVSAARQAEDWRADASLDGGPLSPQQPPVQRRRLSSFKDAKKLKHNFVKHSSTYAQEEDSLDAEDIFDLEGTDSNLSRNDLNSDVDDYDSDNSESNDEGIQIARGRAGAAAMSIARSLPVNVPKFSHENHSSHYLDDEEDPQDIAASIKALARSVHGDVFGDLPRPRFSTQI